MIRQRRTWGERAIIGLPTLWLTVFFVVPLLIILRMSLSDPASAQPPYKPVWDGSIAGIAALLAGFDFENYITILTDSLYVQSFLTSLRIAALGTVLTLLVGYPIALAISRASREMKPLLLALVILPFWTSFLIRIYAWIAILKQEGLLNQTLLALGIVSAPLEILNTEWAVQIGIVYAYLPFMVLPIYASLDRHDATLLEAAQDLGSTPFRAFWLVTWPLSLAGIVGGCVLVFIPVMGEFIIPDLLGGSDTLMIGKLVWTEFFNNRDWPMASTMAIALLVIIALPVVFAQRRQLHGGKA
ncbi:MAG: ABC transporter permease [Beijerinckiaceae bacterium]